MAQPKERRRRSGEAAGGAFARKFGKGFDLLFLHSPLPMWIYAPHSGRFVEVNEAAIRTYGYSRAEFLSKTLFDIRPPEDRARLAGELERQHGSGAGFSASRGWRHLRRDGSVIWVDVHSQELDNDGETVRLAIVHDVTALKQSEEAVARLYRITTVLGGINSLIVRARSRDELFRESCRLAVETGGFRVAWIAVLDGDTVRPAACCSTGGTTLDSMRELLADGLPANSPTAIALREGRVVACDDIAAPHRFASWLQRAQMSDARSCLVQPLFVGGRVAGSLSLYATEPGAFADEERKLLAEVADNIAYSMEFIARDEQLDYVAFYDPVTHLANRSLLLQRLPQYLRAARETRQQLAVLLLDIERFAAVNATVGRDNGDIVLRTVGGRLQQAAGGPTNIARIGGDQFAIVLPTLKSVDELTQTLRDPVWSHLGGPIRVGDMDLQLRGRLGVSVFPDDGEDAETLLRNAEAALRQARAGGERFLLYTKEMTDAVRERHLLEVRLRHALEHEEFVLHYQPKVDTRSGAICGAEALIRWHSPELGLVPPDRFIPLLEETGLIVEVGRQALVEAAAAVSRWKRQGVTPVPVSVNVSPIQLRQPGFVQMIKDAVFARGEEALIGLEVTESMLLGDTEAIVQRLRRIRAMGVSIAIDDFGTGYSSLSYLSALPVDVVKIDRSFVSGLADSADTVSIVASIVSLARSLGLRVVAEGIETTEQLRFLRMLECDELQGFLISRPLPEADFVAFLRHAQHANAGESTLHPDAVLQRTGAAGAMLSTVPH